MKTVKKEGGRSHLKPNIHVPQYPANDYTSTTIDSKGTYSNPTSTPTTLTGTNNNRVKRVIKRFNTHTIQKGRISIDSKGHIISNSSMEQDLDHFRIQFGDHVSSLRREKAMTLVQLASAISVTHPAVVAVEKGRRSVGDSLALRLANALEVNGEDRERFMMLAAATRIKHRLVGSANQAPPTLTHYLVKQLQKADISMNQICQAQLTQNINGDKTQNQAIKQQFESGTAQYLKALAANTLSSLPLLELNLENGRRVFCAMLLAST